MEKLCLKFISDSVKLKLINEIAMDYGLQLWYLGCDNRPKQHLLQVGLPPQFIFLNYGLIQSLFDEKLKNLV